MQVVSLNIGPVVRLNVDGRTVETGINKLPVEGPLRVTTAGFAGDGNADREKWGGVYQAVCAYPSEHYCRLRELLEEPDLPFGFVGENLSTRGLLETEVCIGSVYRIGSAVLQVTKHRPPCRKLLAKAQSKRLARVWMQEKITGWYMRVLSDGTIAPGDRVHIEKRDAAEVTVADYADLLDGSKHNREELRRVLRCEGLEPAHAERLRQKLKEQP